MSRREANAPDPLHHGLRQLLEALERSEQALRATGAFGSDAERTAAYAQLLRNLAMGLEAEVFQDPDHPFFGPVDFWRREGGSNPDQGYACSPIRGGERYRIHGRLGSALSIELQLYAEQPWRGPGRSVGLLSFEDLIVEPDGRFAVELVPGKPDETGPGELHSPPEATTVMVRQVYDDWSSGDPGELHIDRIGHEGQRVPSPSGELLGRRLEAAARSVEQAATVWPSVARKYYFDALEANLVPPPHDTHAHGGVRGRWMSTGHYRLESGTALVVRMPRSEASYQAIQLADPCFAALERGSQVTSLNTRQAQLAPDDAYHCVISLEEPGYPDWLDAAPFERGLFMLRWDGVRGPIPPEQHPSARVLALSELPDAIPGFVRIDAAERERTRWARRRHLQARYRR
jgi:hypothetical protein